ncbi:amidoligase family protein [Acidaminococcus fermentans]|uniref:amidoligase family protein n=1 Tax=Acidaminococcus fermentans TaxID=905 RepID=UPI00242CC76E|nr:amidoligase family protein [Acidaminococcus fermentans]
MKTLHFGIEMEMTGITREKAANLMASFFGTGRGTYEGGAYDTYTALDNQGRTWKAMSDSSIRPQRKVGGQIEGATRDYRTEVVSPILSYDDIPKLQELVRILRKAGALVNTSCGIHIHVGAEKFTPKTLRNLVNLVASKEDMIYHALQIDAPREARYCQKTDETFLWELNKKQPRTMAEFADIWYIQAPFGRDEHYNNSRYHGLNLHATFTKGTVEFRLFNGTLHAGEIKAYIQFCLAVAHQALTQKKASARKTETDNEKYAFRCWMLRLGLIGEEFKTCRLHMLKHLNGNSAWRNAA